MHFEEVKLPKLSNIVGFRKDLFFGGAIDVDWFEKDKEKRDKAAANFVFHGPEYFGLSDEDKKGGKGYDLIDTVSLANEIIKNTEPQYEDKNPISLAIASYGAGKSHFIITLATLLSDPKSSTSHLILDNLKKADSNAGKSIEKKLKDWKHPILVVPINGMNNFDLADELSKQVLIQLRGKNLDTSAIEDLYPRFQIAIAFVERNFELWKEKFFESFDPGIRADDIIEQLKIRDEVSFKKVNIIYENANGYPIHATGAESPKQLLETVCQHYCGENGPFQSILILFDEFGRYLEFAVEKPHIAGDAALQQIFEGVHENSDLCSMLCTIQYELKTYISRVSPEHQNTITRFVGRYDASKKYYVSSNLETLFAHLIDKKEPDFISKCVPKNDLKNEQEAILSRTPEGQLDSIWRDENRFHQVIGLGCWPFHPLAILFLRRMSPWLQQRSAVMFIADAIARKGNSTVTNDYWSLKATALFQPEKGQQDPLIQELINTEHYAAAGSSAYAYLSVEEKYRNDLEESDRNVLLSVLIATKIGLKPSNQEDAYTLFASLSGDSTKAIKKAISELSQEFGILEWNERFKRYEILSDAVPRSAFNRFLDRKVRQIPADKIDDLFVMHAKKLIDLSFFHELDPEFSNHKDIRTSEWKFKTFLSTRKRMDEDINLAIQDWKEAIDVDKPKGQLIYCYFPADTVVSDAEEKLKEKLKSLLKKHKANQVPLFAVILHDDEEKLRRCLSEYYILHEEIADEEKQKYGNFIEDQKQRIQEEISLEYERLVNKKNYVLPLQLSSGNNSLEGTAFEIFDSIYDKAITFPFDKFDTSKGGAAVDCRDMTVELFKGKLNHEWYSAAPKRVQNRAKAVLVNGWKAFDDRKIALFPKHEELNRIIKIFDETLSKQKFINLHEIFQILTSPPHGYNIASAGLVMGLFMSPRLENIAITYEEKSITPSNWISKAFSKNFLNPAALSKTKIQRVKTDEWQALLHHWDSEDTHLGRIKYLEQAEELKQRVPLSSEALYERWKNLKEKAEKSVEKIVNFDNFLSKQDHFLGKALSTGDVGSLSRVGYDLVSQLQRMKEDRKKWTEDQLSRITKRIDKTRHAIEAMFEDWLLQQSCISSEKVGSFREHMIKYTSENLKLMGLDKLADKVEQRAIKIISDIKERQRVYYSVEAARSFLNQHNISTSTTMTELIEWPENAAQLKQDLERARTIRDVPEINEHVKKLEQFIKACSAQEKEQWELHTDLLSRSFLNIAEIEEINNEIKQVINIFYGQDPEYEDLKKLERRLTMFQEDFYFWDKLSVSNDELEKLVAEKIEEVSAAESNDDMLPEWKGVDEIYANLLKELIERRRQRSNNWLSSILSSQDDIAEMSTEGCKRLFSLIDSIPAYITHDDLNKVENLRKEIQDRLSEIWVSQVYKSSEEIWKMPADECHYLILKLNSAPEYVTDKDLKKINRLTKEAENRLAELNVEGLLIRFRNLPLSMQKEFLRLAAAELDKIT